MSFVLFGWTETLGQRRPEIVERLTMQEQHRAGLGAPPVLLCIGKFPGGWNGRLLPEVCTRIKQQGTET